MGETRAVLRAMILKDLRTVFRQRGQVPRTALNFALVLFFLVSLLVSTDGETWVRWSTLAFVAVMSLLCGVAFGSEAGLSVFVEEREGRTAELLLASPLSDRRLYTLRLLSGLFPSAATAYIVLLGAGIPLGVWTWAALPEATAVEVAWGALAALPLPWLICAVVVGGVALISARAESSQGAAHIFGVAVLTTSGGCALLLFLVLVYEGSTLHALIHRWMALGFGAQYGILLGSASSLALGLLFAGYCLFDRERLLR